LVVASAPWFAFPARTFQTRANSNIREPARKSEPHKV
jgi:hypothetical protein